MFQFRKYNLLKQDSFSDILLDVVVFPLDAFFSCMAYNEQEKRAVHIVFLGGGSGFSSPCVSFSSSPRLVYAATLRGIVSAVQAVS